MEQLSKLTAASNYQKYFFKCSPAAVNIVHGVNQHLLSLRDWKGFALKES